MVASIDDIYNILTNEKEGLVTKFTNETQLAPLRNVLIEAFDLKKSKTVLNDNKIHNKKLLANDKEVINFINKIDKSTNGIFKLTSKLTSNSGGLFSKFMGGIQLLSRAGRVLFNASMKYLELTTQYYKNLKVLSDAGVSLRDGFDETFATYAAMGKLTQENYAKLVNSTSKFIMRYNQVASKQQKSGEEILSLTSKRLMGHYGLDEKQMTNAMSFIMSYTDVVSGSELRQRDLTTQTERLVKDFKALSRATGVSIENYLEMNKQQEKELVIREIMADPKRAAKFMAAQTTFGTDAALYMETGIANEKALQMMADPRGLQALQHAREGYLKAETDNNGLTDKGMNTLITYFNESIQGPIDSIKKDVANMPSALQMLGNNFYTGIYDFALNARELNETGMNKILADTADNETSIISQFAILNQSVDIIKELMIQKVVPDSKKAAALYSAMGKKITDVQEVLWGKDYQKIRAAQAGVDYDKMAVTERKLSSGGFFTTEEGQKRRANLLLNKSREKLLDYLKKGKTIEDYNKDAALWHLLIASKTNNGDIGFFDKGYYENFNKIYPQYQAWKKFGNSIRENNGRKYYFDELTGKYYSEGEYNLKLKSLESQLVGGYGYVQGMLEKESKTYKDEFNENLEKISGKIDRLINSSEKTAENTGAQVEKQEEANDIEKSKQATDSMNAYRNAGFAVAT